MWGLRSSSGAPISVEGRLWGVIVVASTSEAFLPADTETRLAGFTELVGTALANTEAQAALTASRARIVAAADTARRRIERANRSRWCGALLGDRVAAVHDQALPGDVGRAGAGQPRNGGGDLVG